MKNDLNSVLVEGKVIQVNDDNFIIQSFYLPVPTEDFGFENRFKVMSMPSIPVEVDKKVRVVGRLRCQNGDPLTSIIPAHMDVAKY